MRVGVLSFPLTFGLGAGCLWIGLSCSSSPPLPPVPAHSPRVQDAAADAVAKRDPRVLEANVIAVVQEGTLGPYVAYGRETSLAFYAPKGTDARRWLAQPLSPTGAPVGKAQAVADAPDQAPVVAIRQLPPDKGFFAMWTRSLDQAHSLEAVGIHADGQAHRAPSTIVQAPTPIVWADVIASPSGPIVFWAEQRRDRANVFATRVDSSGQTRTAPSPVLAGVKAWQVTPTPNGAAVAAVRPPESSDSAGAVVVQLVDGSGRLIGAPVSVTEASTALPDLDMVRIGGSLVLAWTDRRDTDSHIFVAALDTAGKVVTPPRALTAPRGEQSLIALAAPFERDGGKGLIAYEEIAERTPQMRAIRLVTVDQKAATGARTALLQLASGEREVPELVGAANGFALLTVAPACLLDTPCSDAQPVPTYVRLGSDLTLVASAPLLVDKLSAQIPSNAWGLGCSQTACTALAAGFTSPAPVVTIPLPSTKSAYVPVSSIESLPTPPFLESSRVIYTLDEHLSKIAAANVGGNTLVAWVTYFVEPPAGSAPRGAPTPKPVIQPRAQPSPRDAPGDPRKPAAAHLSVIALDASGKPMAPPTVVSVRALSAGGVALAAGAPGTKDVGVAWVARDEGDPQVFVTRMGGDAKREAQQMITRAKGDAADAAIAWAGDGWIVAWVDWRDGNGEVYAAKVDRALRKVIADTRLTSAAGDASDVALLVRDKEVFVAYADPRDHLPEGSADPYVQKLQTASLMRVGEEYRIDTTQPHSRCVRLAGFGDDVVVAWLEQSVRDMTVGAGSPLGMRFAVLDPKTGTRRGNVGASTSDVPSLPTGLGLSCTRDLCKGIVSVSVSDRLRAEAAVWSPSSLGVSTKPIMNLTGPPGEDILPVVIDNDVFFADRGTSGDVRLRRVHLEWTAR